MSLDVGPGEQGTTTCFSSPDSAYPLPDFAAELIALRIGAVTETTPVPAETTPAPEGSPTEVAGGVPTVNMVDISFDPKELTIAAYTDVTITLFNIGAAVHNFNLDEPSVRLSFKENDAR